MPNSANAQQKSDIAVAPGGVGQSLLTHHIDNIFRGSHSFLDTTVYYSDDELRKQADGLVGKIVVTGQEAVQGTGRGFRVDLYKKHMSGDPVQARLPYAIVTKLVELIGWKRMELNKLVEFADVTAENFDSIFRRSWVCRLRARFVSGQQIQDAAVAAQKGIFLRDPSLKSFLTSSQAACAGLKIIHGFMLKVSKAGAEELIEDYVGGGDGGITEASMRIACSLPPATNDDKGVGIETSDLFDPVASASRKMQEVTEKLAITALEQDCDLTLSFASGLKGVVPGNTRQKRKTYLDQLAAHGFLIQHGSTMMGTHVYAPNVRTANTIEGLYDTKQADVGESFPERFNVAALRTYLTGNEARLHNVVKLQEYYAHRAASLRARFDPEKDELLSLANKLSAHEQNAAKLLQRIESSGVAADASGFVTIQCTYEYKHGVRSRRYVVGCGSQSISRRLRCIALGNVDEWDIANCHCVLAVAFATRLQIQIDPKIASLPGLRSYVNDRASAVASIGKSYPAAKVVFIKTLNGAKLSEEYEKNECLVAVELLYCASTAVFLRTKF